MGVTKLDLLRDLDPLSTHILASRRGKAGEIGKTRQDLEELVWRLVGSSVRPEILSWDPVALDSTSTIQVTFKGRDLIPDGWAKASAVVNTGVANSALLWTAILPGECGELISVRYTTDGTPVHISAVGNIITVKLETGVTTANAIIAELALHPEVARMATAANYGGSTGAGIPTTYSPTFLAGGLGVAALTAYLQTALGANRDLLYRSRVPGAKGDTISLQYSDTGITVPVVTCLGAAIVVGVNAGVTTANAVLAAVRASTAARKLVDVDLAAGHNGSGVVSAVAHTHLSTHATDWNAGWVPQAGNQPGTVSATVGYDSITDDTAVVTFPVIAAPQVITGGIMVQLPTCGHVHRLYFTAVL